MAKHAPKTDDTAPDQGVQKLPDPERKRRRTRRKLIAVIVLLVLVVAGLGAGATYLIVHAQKSAAEKTQQGIGESDISGEASDLTGSSARVTIPKLTGALGKGLEDALAVAGHGAQILTTKTDDTADAKVHTTVTATLEDDPEDSMTGKPRVYIGMNWSGIVVCMGYSASTTALGYGSTSFSELINTSHAVEKCLNAIGVAVGEGECVLPADSSEYRTYEDGKLTRESFGFEGELEIDGAWCPWEAAVIYDYSLANNSGNLGNAVCQIYVYVYAY